VPRSARVPWAPVSGLARWLRRAFLLLEGRKPSRAHFLQGIKTRTEFIAWRAILFAPA
jgi:hypothetical protein